MMKIRIVFNVLLLVVSFFLVKEELDQLDLIINGKKVTIEKGYFAVPLICYSDRNSYDFLKFEYKGKHEAIRITHKSCLKIQGLESLTLFTNSEETIFVFSKRKVILELIAAIFLFLVCIFCFYKLNKISSN